MWEDEIYEAIAASSVVMAIISSDFPNSEFISAKELPVIFAAKERRRLAIFPVIVRPCAFEFHKDLAKFQCFNDPQQPLSTLKESEMEQELVRLVRAIALATKSL